MYDRLNQFVSAPALCTTTAILVSAFLEFRWQFKYHYRLRFTSRIDFKYQPFSLEHSTKEITWGELPVSLYVPIRLTAPALALLNRGSDIV